MAKPRNISSPSWIQITQLLLLLIIISLSCAATCTAIAKPEHDKDVSLSYSAHCGSVIPKPTHTQEEDQQGLDDYVVFFPRRPFAHVTGEAPFLNDRSSITAVSFGRSTAYKTRSNGVIKVEVTLNLNQKLGHEYSSDFGSGSSRRNPVGTLTFRLSGYLHEETGDVCMVGFGHEFYNRRDVITDNRAVFKMSNFKKKSSIITSLITATLESLSSAGDSSYFKPISLMMFNEMGYEYGLVLKENSNGGFDGIDGDDDVLKSLPLPLGPRNTLCSIFDSFYQFELLYPSSCDHSGNICSPIRRSNIGYLPRGLTLSSITCDNKERKLRVLVNFFENGYQIYDYSNRFDPKTSLIGEGIWDGYQFVGDHMYEGKRYTPTPGFVEEKNPALQVPINMSYTISYQKMNHVGLNGTKLTTGSTKHQQNYVLIVAEGIYDPRTGALCMIGCRRVGSVAHVTTENDGIDCEIVINFQLPSRNSRTGYAKGSIASTRKSNDSLYFEHLELISSAYTSSVASENIWRMDFEIILVLSSNTLACVFIAFQLVYVTRHPQILPFASLITLAVLALGYMLPLLLNFEASFMPKHGHQNVLLESGNWIEVNEVLVRVVTMVAFLLQFRLVQLTWSSRVHEKMSIWAPEKKGSLYVLLPIYIIGALVTCILNWQKDDKQQLLGDLKSYAGLILNGFLLPQILLNIFSNTKEKTLSAAYYIGTTFVRLLPHAYDLYRGSRDQNAARFERSYIYANHDVDFYSLAWDVAIPCVALGFAAIIFLQQRFGGRSVLPRRFREDESYEKVPAVSFDL